MKYVIAICVVIITFLFLYFAYLEEVPQDSTRSIIVWKECTLNDVFPGKDYVFNCPAKTHDRIYTVTVPKACTLNEVVAGEDYIFDCPRDPGTH